MKIKFATSAFKDYRQWEKENPKIFKRINRLLENIKQSPFEGIGNPEPLKYNWQGYWSRRITQEHHLIYSVKDDVIFVVQCKFNY
ncbi:MAG: Txe/YoeB family addiction module toxin [Xenococcaceae cyanobacterium MO_167.B27]|nr:Txe/YoeB family addiction module toxin [Xenococcaceae cyanobacterium MO_167.B27]